MLQMMAKETELKAQAICLMLQLWKRQDRCFPYLETLLTESNKSFTFESGVNEILIAQAAAILEICHNKYEIFYNYNNVDSRTVRHFCITSFILS